ncbi:hypothetical protein WJX74_005588 [Apatococcus lobatus]|uniref:Uncharacterized protein n=1 Tax=Apatococcus lobatus TaxID=904363 RepID=A0AAW1RH65_9CHLO
MESRLPLFFALACLVVAAHAGGTRRTLMDNDYSKHDVYTSSGRMLQQAVASTNGGGVVAGTPLFGGSAQAISGVLNAGFAAATAANPQYPPVSTATAAACQAANNTAHANSANAAANQAAQANNYAASAESAAASTFINSVFQSILGAPGAVGAAAGRRKN